MNKILFGAAYYLEYLPKNRDIEQDVAMMKKAGINTVRIAESTWSTEEPQDGVFDFSYVDKVCDVMEKHGINVIIGTPTYAIPAWLAKAHPEVLATTETGKQKYGARQIYDISHPTYRYYAERIIRNLVKRTAPRKNVIGFQVDNETKYYGNASHNVQLAFIKRLRKEFKNDLEKLNDAFGLNYWSNRIDAWEDFPDVTGTINGSLGCEFDKFRRSLVDDFLEWQVNIVKEYKRDDQFITQNFDYEWVGYSYGLQPVVNHFKAAKSLTISGVDIYHPTQSKLTGCEIGFGGDIARSVKKGNFLVIETQAQGQLGWLPFHNQLRLQAYSHLANGANSILYWHWHSIHNSFETYWKGIVSHDFSENETYKEACVLGHELEKLGKKIVNLKKKNDIAIMVSNESLTALDWFRLENGMLFGESIKYNDVFRWIYDCLFKLNAEVDMITVDETDLSQYKMIILPVLYSVSEATLNRLKEFVKNGGYLVSTFRSAVTNEYVKVYNAKLPHILHECFGASYSEHTIAEDHGLESTDKTIKPIKVMELLIPDKAETLYKYEDPNWGKYSAVTRNTYGKGKAVYIACMTTPCDIKKLFTQILKDANLWSPKNELSDKAIVREGTNDSKKRIRYFFNYSSASSKFNSYVDGVNIVNDKKVSKGQECVLEPWGLLIIESDN